MPELPEVEVTRRALCLALRNHSFPRVWDYVRSCLHVSPSSHFFFNSPEIKKIFYSGKKLRGSISQAKLNQLRNQPLIAIYRRGKYLIWVFQKYWLVLHLGMSGYLEFKKLVYQKSQVENRQKKKIKAPISSRVQNWYPLTPELMNSIKTNRIKHTHFEWIFSSAMQVIYVDPRRFGSLRVFSVLEVERANPDVFLRKKFQQNWQKTQPPSSYKQVTGNNKSVHRWYRRMLARVSSGSCRSAMWRQQHMQHWPILQIPNSSRLGIEPLEMSMRLLTKWLVATFNQFAEKKKSEAIPSSSIKSFLMDQKKIAGLGNIYVNEILFSAGIHPMRQIHTFAPQKNDTSSSLTTDIHLLARAIQRILKQAIRFNGSTIKDFRSNGEGSFQDSHQVYQRHGKPCYRCHSKIQMIQLNQRATYFCESCQLLPHS